MLSENCEKFRKTIEIDKLKMIKWYLDSLLITIGLCIWISDL
jgi:hypothetical protein